MDTRNKLRAVAIAVVVLQQQLPGLLIQRRVRIRIDKQALDSHEYVADPVLALPVLLQRVDTDLARTGHVRVEDLRGKPTWQGD